MSMVSEAIAESYGDQIDALNDRNRYLEKELGLARRRIHVLEKELTESQDYSRQQSDKQAADDEWLIEMHGYRGQP